ncbi:MAG: hypothetical protein P9M14_01380, partial [Candidatus Alcyoniella australis]|nr:hypothetical protein [Candidatus Alcyoniella australis]
GNKIKHSECFSSELKRQDSYILRIQGGGDMTESNRKDDYSEIFAMNDGEAGKYLTPEKRQEISSVMEQRKSQNLCPLCGKPFRGAYSANDLPPLEEMNFTTPIRVLGIEWNVESKCGKKYRKNHVFSK